MRATCERCGAPQPRDWKAGDLCTSCGGAARAETRCAACTVATPEGKFCRACGAPLVPRHLYGAARMLRAGGVDSFDLARRVLELDPDLAGDLTRRFEAQHAVVLRCVDAVARLDEGLVLGGHAARLEAELFPRLPLPAGGLEALGDPAALPLHATLAALHALRREGPARETFRAALGALGAPDPEIAAEAALVLCDPRTRLQPFCYEVDARAMASALEGIDLPAPAAAWRSAVLARSGAEGVDLSAALASTDGMLALEAAVASSASTAIAGFLDHEDEQARAVAAFDLAAKGDARVARFLDEGPELFRHEVLRRLPDELPPGLFGPVLRALERGDEGSRESAAWKLAPLLDEASADRVIAVAARARDGRVLNALLRAGGMPVGAAVLRGIHDACLFALPWTADALRDAVRAARVPADAVADLLERASDEDRLCGMLALAEELASTGGGQAPALRSTGGGQVADVPSTGDVARRIDRAMTRAAFSPLGSKARLAAAWALYRSARARGERDPRYRLDLAGAQDVFGGADAAVAALLSVLDDDATLLEVGYYDWLAGLLSDASTDLFAAAPDLSVPAIASLERVAADDRFWAMLRSAARGLASRIAAGTGV
ncbi:MAG: hypothetical protein U0166_24800 [Acidobacteriota bacterium]